MILLPGTPVRWYRLISQRQTDLVDAVVVRRITNQSVIIKLKDGTERTVRVENLMEAEAV